jgi:hypothetical protein
MAAIVRTALEGVEQGPVLSACGTMGRWEPPAEHSRSLHAPG